MKKLKLIASFIILVSICALTSISTAAQDQPSIEKNNSKLIRDITVEGLKSIKYSKFEKILRNFNISGESKFNSKDVENAITALKEVYAKKGKPDVQITYMVEEISKTTVAINFLINEKPKGPKN